MQIQFGTDHSPHRSKVVSASRMVNCYLEKSPVGAKSPVAVIPSEGLELFATVGSNLRGATVINDVPYLVSGKKLYRLYPNGTVAELGDGIPGSGPASVIGDGINVIVMSDGAGAIYDGTSVTPINDSDFPGANWVAYLDGYIVFSEPFSGRVYVAGPYDPNNINALDFATAEGAPDDVLYGIVEKRELFLFGRESIEVWVNTGNADFPLERVGSGFIEMGIYSPFAATKADNSVCFVGNDKVVYRLNGYTPQRISTHVEEQAISALQGEDIRMFWWMESGHRFLGVTSSQFTLVYDFSTNLWSSKESYGMNRWNASFAFNAFRQYFIASENRVGKLTPDSFTEFGEVLSAQCDSCEIFDENKFIDHNCLELCFDVGKGTPTGQGSDPQVMIRFSDDSGHTWSNEKWRSLGKQGEYEKRVRLLRAGRSRRRVYRYTITDPVRRTLTGAYLNS
jgi:hypothetical protein